jgi:integrase
VRLAEKTNDRAEAMAEAAALNAMVDQFRGGQPVLAKNTHGTIPWIIDTFKQSPTWSKLRPNTVKAYQASFRALLRWSAKRGDPPMRTITRRDAEALWSSEHARAPRMAELMVARCHQLWAYALDLDEEVVTRNPFHRLGFDKQPPRTQVWRPEQIAAVCRAAVARGRPSMALATVIAINTAQRPIDIIALKWSQYDGRMLTLTQIKTGAPVTIPVTEELREALDAARRALTEAKVVALAADGPIVVGDYKGRAWASRNFFTNEFRRACTDAGIPSTLQFRDLRRTATVHLAEAGCTLHEIAAIGGWSVATVAKMMAVYGKTNVAMAENAIAKLEQYRRSKRPLEV